MEGKKLPENHQEWPRTRCQQSPGSMANTLRIWQYCNEKQRDDDAQEKGTRVKSQILAEWEKKSPKLTQRIPQSSSKEAVLKRFYTFLGKNRPNEKPSAVFKRTDVSSQPLAKTTSIKIF